MEAIPLASTDFAVQILRNMQGYEGIGRHAVQESQDTVPESSMLHAER